MIMLYAIYRIFLVLGIKLVSKFINTKIQTFYFFFYVGRQICVIVQYQ